MSSIEGNPADFLDPQSRMILVIDDAPTTLAVLGQYLTMQRFHVMAARDGEMGLQLARQDQPDLILLDVQLPGIDGFETCRRLKADERTREIPVIFMTIVTKTEDKVRGFEVGGVDYIAKPFQHEEVLARVMTHLRLRGLMREIEAVKENLEKRVVERTDELAQANVRLEREIAERQRAEDELRAAHQQLSNIIDFLPDATFVIDRDKKVIAWNRAIEEMTGTRKEDIIGQGDYAYAIPWYGERRPIIIDLIEADHPEIRSGYEYVHKQGNTLFAEVFVPSVFAGRGAYLWVTASPLLDSAGKQVGAIESLRDITERKQAEEALHRLNRELRAISNCNQILLRAVDEQALLNDICRIICDEAGYCMAWVGYAENDDAKTVRPAAWAGNEAGYLANANITWADTERGRDPTSTAIRSGESACIQDFATDPQAAPWRENALQRGYRASIALPLKDENAKTFGALTIYSTEPNTFTPEEIRLLEELAGDLAFGIAALRTRAERKRAEEALRESEKKFRSFVESSSEGFTLVDEQGVIIEWNPAREKMTGLPASQVIGQKLWDVQYQMALPTLQTPEFYERFKQTLLNALQTGQSPLFDHVIETEVHPYSSSQFIQQTIFPIETDKGYRIGSVTSDITERRRAEEALRESEVRYRTLFAHAPDAIFLENEDDEILDVNPAACVLLGYSREELLAMQVSDLQAPELRGQLGNVIKNELSRHGSIPFEGVDLRRDGTRVAVEISNSWMGDSGLALSIVRDITERKQAEQALWESSQMLRLVLDNMPAFVFWKDRNGVYLGCNYLYAANAGLSSPEEIIGKTDLDLPWKDAEAESYRADDRMVMETGIPKLNYEETQLIADGRVTQVRTSKIPLRNPEGDVIGVLGTFEDISERRRAEEALRESEGRYRLVAENASDIIFTMGLDLRFTYISPSVTRILGYTIEEAMANTLDQVLMPASLERAIQVFTEELAIEASESKQLWHARTLELEQICKDGSTIWTETTLAPLRDSENQAVGVIGITRDITERKRAEAELKQHRDHLEELVRERTAELSVAKEAAEEARRTAEAASQAKSVFLANMSHELRTPLNAVLGYAQLLQRDRALAASHLDAVNTIERSGQHLLTLITDILDLSKIEAGKLDLSPGDLHLPNFLQEIASLMYLRAGQKSLGFKYQTETMLPHWVQADEKRLRQVLINLLSNAVKFTDRGAVTFHVKVREQAPHSIDPRPAPTVGLRFAVIDTGVGIAADQLERIFLPFEQASNRPQYLEGAGLGLAISRQLVRALGGDIYVSSTLGEGSTFWFDLELPTVTRSSATVQLGQRQAIGYRGPRRKALIVDDQPDNRLILVDLLHSLGFDLREAANGQQAIESARDWKPDLILMDMFMPVLSGFEATRLIRQLPDLSATIIVGVSAGVSEADTQHILQAGCHAVMPKPIDVDKLLALLASHLKLEWMYPPVETLSSEPVEPERELIPPPLEELAILYDLARQGNLRGIQARAAQLEQLDQQYQPFADQLQHLARNFEDKAVLALINRYIDEHS